jgi:hypothetical protein
MFTLNHHHQPAQSASAFSISFRLLLLVLIVWLFTSCSKDVSVGVQEELPSKPKGDKAIKHCEISKVVDYNPFLLSPRVFTFEYNSKGDPIKITPTLVSTGSPKHEFRYDHKGRLTDYIGPYNNGAFEFWHVYGYDNKGRIATDTTYIFGNYGALPTNDLPSLRRHVTYEYDEQDRIKKMTTVFPFAPFSPEVQEYAYDADGNRIIPGVVYDGNINPLRTNAIWMFINRDYSVNNQWNASSFTSMGLPEAINVPHTRQFIAGALYPQLIEYNCKGELAN